jgi:hypothetical protein
MEASAAATSTDDHEEAPSPAGDGPGPQQPEYVPPAEPGAGPGEDEDDDDRPVLEPPELDDHELLEPKTEHVERVIGPDIRGRDAKYIQKPLTYFGKIELYGLLGRAVQIVMEGDGGLGLDQLMDFANPKDMLGRLMSSLPGADTAPDADEDEVGLDDAAKMLAAFSKVISVAPGMMKEAYCIVLNIPLGHRKWAIEWGLPEIDDETGEDILHTFVDQNWGVMEDFFARELPKIAKRIVQARARHRQSVGDR